MTINQEFIMSAPANDAVITYENVGALIRLKRHPTQTTGVYIEYPDNIDEDSVKNAALALIKNVLIKQFRPRGPYDPNNDVIGYNLWTMFYSLAIDGAPLELQARLKRVRNNLYESIHLINAYEFNPHELLITANQLGGVSGSGHYDLPIAGDLIVRFTKLSHGMRVEHVYNPEPLSRDWRDFRKFLVGDNDRLDSDTTHINSIVVRLIELTQSWIMRLHLHENIVRDNSAVSFQWADDLIEFKKSCVHKPALRHCAKYKKYKKLAWVTKSGVPNKLSRQLVYGLHANIQVIPVKGNIIEFYGFHTSHQQSSDGLDWKQLIREIDQRELLRMICEVTGVYDLNLLEPIGVDEDDSDMLMVLHLSELLTNVPSRLHGTHKVRLINE